MALTRRDIERELAIRQELGRRRAKDTLQPERPHAGQLPFIHAVLGGPTTENWLIAANRVGKSDAGAFCGAVMARFGDDRARFVGALGSRTQVKDRSTSGWVSTLDFSMSRDVIQPKYFDNGFRTPDSMEPFIPAWEIDEWRTQDQVLKLKNGSIIGFKSADSGRPKFQGTDRDWVHIDEEHPFDIYKEITLRVGTRKLNLFSTLTLLPPEGQKRTGSSWVYQSIYKPWQLGAFPHMGIFTASIYDNPYIPSTEIMRLESLYPEGSIERRIRLGGEILPGMGGTRAYGNFETQIHVKPLGSYNPLLPLCWIFDFNVEPMLSLVGQRIVQYGEPMFRFYHELKLDMGSIPDMVDLFWNTIPRGYRMIHIYGDSTSQSRSRQTGKSDYTLILNNMRAWNIPVRMFVPPINPPVVDRINAMNSALSDEKRQTHIEIDPSCLELIADLEQVLKDPRGGIKKTFDRSDPYVSRTHASDAAGYWIAYERPVIGINSQGYNKRPGLGTRSIPAPGYQGIR